MAALKLPNDNSSWLLTKSRGRCACYKDCRVTPLLVNPRVTRVAKTPKFTPRFAIGVTLRSWVNQPEIYPLISNPPMNLLTYTPC